MDKATLLQNSSWPSQIHQDDSQGEWGCDQQADPGTDPGEGAAAAGARGSQGLQGQEHHPRGDTEDERGAGAGGMESIS